MVWLNSVLAWQPDHWGAHQELADYYERNLSRGPSFERLARQHRERARELAPRQQNSSTTKKEEQAQPAGKPVESVQP